MVILGGVAVSYERGTPVTLVPTQAGGAAEGAGEVKAEGGEVVEELGEETRI